MTKQNKPMKIYNEKMDDYQLQKEGISFFVGTLSECFDHLNSLGWAKSTRITFINKILNYQIVKI